MGQASKEDSVTSNSKDTASEGACYSAECDQLCSQDDAHCCFETATECSCCANGYDCPSSPDGQCHSTSKFLADISVIRSTKQAGKEVQVWGHRFLSSCLRRS